MKHLLLLLFISYSFNAFAQYDYAASPEHPFGLLNPDAPQEVGDYASLIGESSCQSESRSPDGTWNAAVDMLWTYKYIMNGAGVQDLSLKDDGNHSGSIRQFNADSSAWYVHYYSSGLANSTLSAWKGASKQDDAIVLYREQAAPNGTEGFYKITFSEISDNSFNWRGAWVNTDESIIYPTWKIACSKITK